MNTVTQSREILPVEQEAPRVIEVPAARSRDQQTGRFIKIYRLAYLTLIGGETVRMVRHLPKRGVESVGKVVGRLADRGQAWGIAVLTATGEDVTLEFECFGEEA